MIFGNFPTNNKLPRGTNMPETYIFRFFGFLTFVFEVSFIYMLTRPRVWEDLDSEALVRTTVFLVISAAVGTGLMLSRKWAAILLSLATTAYSIWLAVGSILGVPFPYILINFSFSVMLLIPLFATISYWHSLQWSGKYYL